MSDVLVIGGGPAGAAAAIGLARAGRTVTLLERERGPHDKVCGEFLSAMAAASLRRLGLDLEALGARPIDRIVLRCHFSTAQTDLPFAALGLSRRTMDEALLQHAKSEGVSVQRGVRATQIDGARGDWRVRVDGGEDFEADEVLIATGKHNLRGAPRGKGGQPDLIGFKLHLSLTGDEIARLEGAVELYLFKGGYAGLQLVEDDLANLCLVVRKARFSDLAGGWDALCAAVGDENPVLAQRLAGAARQTVKPLAISAIPYGYVAEGGDGLWRLGDQAAVIPSFAGEGMAIALQSGDLAAEFLAAGQGPGVFQKAMAQAVATQVRAATLLSQGLVRPWSQIAAMSVARASPGAMRWIADSTRTRVRQNRSIPRCGRSGQRR